MTKRAEKFHRLFGSKNTRIAFKNKDFLDYVFMTCLSALVLHFAYNMFAMSVIALCFLMFMVYSFYVRHGIKITWPVIMRRPQEILFMIAYKLMNLKIMWGLALATLLLENYIIFLTPEWPHKTEFMRSAALYLFSIHFIFIAVYRTVSLIDHLKKREHVKEVLMETAWKRVLTKPNQASVNHEIVHAYLTGMFTHLVLIAPWFLVIQHLNFSLVLMPIVVVMNILIHYLYVKSYSAWFYRDHWLGHNSEFDFIYLHGTHHDAIPSGLIGVSGNGHLEGFLRHTIGAPTPLYNPLVSFILYTLEVHMDLKSHQYIPGIFPHMPREFHEESQHSTHHFGKLEPYSIAIRSLPEEGEQNKRFAFPPMEILNSIALDEELTGFKWDNARYKQFMALYDKYENRSS